MARIYKESRYVLQLLIGKSYGAQYDDVKISFYTKNPSNQVMADDDITIKGNVAEVMVDSTLFDNLEDGLISYIVYGTKDGIPFIEERQSNYFLKTPLDFKPTTCILEDKSVTPSMGDRDGNNLIVVEESEGYDGLSRVVIDPQTLYNEGVEAGRAEGGQGGSCNLGETEFEFGISDFNDIFELSSSDEGYDGWSKVTIKFSKGDWATIYNAGKIFEDYNNGTSPGVGNYGYVCGKITEIQEVNTSADNNYASFTLDNCFKVDKCKWAYWDYNRKEQFESEDQIKVGACAVVFGVFQDNNGSLQFEEGSQMIAYQECRGGSCNLEDKSVTPSMGDRDGNNLIVVEESEGYDGLSRVVIDPQTLYNEGVEAGRAEGGQGGSCNLGTLDWTLTEPNGQQKNASDDGYDGYSAVVVRPENIIAQEKENAINDFKNKMDEITITENGTYSIDDTELTHSISFDGNSYFDTGIVPTENIKIEVCIKVTNGNDSQIGGIIIGGGIDSVNNGTENRGIAIGMHRGAIYGKWGAIKSWNKPYDYVKTTTVVLQKTDDSWQWDTGKGSFGASTLYIGGYNRNGEEVEEKFTQSIVYIKIWTDRNDDSTLITYTPKTNGNFDANGTELQRLGDGTTTFIEENVNKYPYGFKRVEVNVPTDNVPEYPYSHIPTNTIYYKTADGQLSENIGLDLNGRPSGFGLGINGEVLNIVSNTYEDGVGKIVFDGEVYKVGPVMYSNVTETGDEVIKLENIVEIQLPSSITRVENGAFSQTGLREIILPPNITQIDTYALKDMKYLYRIVFYSDEPEILQHNEITLNQTTFGKILHNKAYNYSNMESNTYYKQKGWTFETL